MGLDLYSQSESDPESHSQENDPKKMRRMKITDLMAFSGSGRRPKEPVPGIGPHHHSSRQTNKKSAREDIYHHHRGGEV